METKELKDLCRSVATKNRTTASEKETLRVECESRGYTFNTKCPNCYIDAAAWLYSQIKDEGEDAGPESDRRWVLKKGVSVLFGGALVCEANITDKMAESIVERGFSLRFFAKYPEEYDHK